MQSLAEASADEGEAWDLPLKKLDFQLLYLNKESFTGNISEIEYKSRLKFNAHPHLSYHFLAGSQIFRPPIS